MAITTNTPTISKLPYKEVPKGATFWCVNFTSADVSGREALRAAPGTGKALYLTDFLISCKDADADPYLEDGTSTLLGPFHSTVEGIVVAKTLRRAIPLTANQALNINAAAAGNVSGFVMGYTANS